MPSRRTGTCKERMKKFCLFIYNPRKKLFFNKSGRQWAQYLLYYFGFFCLLLFIFFTMSLMILWNFSRFDTPWQQFKILKKPALTMQPSTSQHAVAYSKKKEEKNILVERLNNFYSKYINFDPDRYQTCSATTTKKKLCYFNLTQLGPCGKEPFGYDGNHICVVLKINKIFGWTPENDGELRNSPGSFTDRTSRKDGFITVSCEALKPLDKESVKEIKYFPESGFPYYYFPFVDQRNYLQPLVAAYFTIKSPDYDDILVTIVCRAKNKDTRLGSIAFQIMIAESSKISYEEKRKIV